MSYSKQNFRSGDTLYASQLNAMDDEIAVLEAEVESTKNMVGSPLTASTVAGMTDQTKIYVYTGTETGYTAGHWYYYNGTAWTDGGVYNSVAVNTDTSLTVSGQAADSKAVGDAINDLDSDLSDVKSDLSQLITTNQTVTPQLTTSAGYINTVGAVAGGESGSTWKCTDFVDISDAINHHVHFRATIYGSASLAWYNSSKEFIACINGSNASQYGLVSQGPPQTFDLTLPSNAKHVRICGHTPSITSENDLLIEYQSSTSAGAGTFLAEELAKKVNVSQGSENAGKVLGIDPNGTVAPIAMSVTTDKTLTQNNAPADAKATGDKITSIEGELAEWFGGSGETVEPTITPIDNYLIYNGNQTGSSSWMCSDFIDVGSRTGNVTCKSTIYGIGSTAWYDESQTVIGYVNGSNASEYGITAAETFQEYSLNLPSNAKYIRMSAYKTRMQTGDALYVSYTSSGGEGLIDEKLDAKVDVNQGSENSGKFLKVNSSGNVEAQDFASAETVFPEFDTESGLILNNGSHNGSSGWTCSDYVDVSGAINHTVTLVSSVYGTASTAWYDENKTFIGYVNGSNASEYGITAKQQLQEYTLTLPSNAVYIRISGYNTYITEQDHLSVSYLAYGETPWSTDIEEAKAELEAEIATKADQDAIDEIATIVGDPKYMNLVDPSKMASNTFITGATGVRSASNYYNSTDFILLRAGTTYYVGGFYFNENVNYHAFYTDASESAFTSEPDVTVTKDSSSHATIEVGSSNVYARFSALKSASNQYVSSLVDYYAEYPGLVTIDDMVKSTSRFKKVLVLGDSISTDNYGGYKKWVTDLIEEGFLPTNTINSSQHASGFVARYDNQPNDFITRIKAIANPETFDLVIVFGGINDANKLIPVGTDSDTDYLTYFKPALNEFYRYLCLNFINARIGILLPLPCSTQNRDASVIGVQYTYSDIQKSVAEAYSLPILDLTNHSGFHPDANKPGINYAAAQAFRMRWTLKVGDYDPDGIHPTEEYEKKFLAPMIKKFIESL